VQILVAEDNIATQKVIEFTLKADKYDLLFAEDGEKAYKLFQTAPPDILITDLDMPIMNGLELIKLVRKVEKSTIPILVLTAHGYPDLVKKVMETGATSFLVKPFDARSLRTRVQAIRDAEL
jgi:DNA-binding response OmpR family regulator